MSYDPIRDELDGIPAAEIFNVAPSAGQRKQDERSAGRAPAMSEPELCARCQHPDHWHRHDDADPTPASDPACKFRCLGYDCERGRFSGGTPETRCGCPDFVRVQP